MGIKRCPSFSKRPGFPCGLRVLLVDGDTAARSHAESMLMDCSYTVTPCSSTAEALARLNSGSSFDVLLADKGMLADKTCNADRQQLLDSCNGMPCIFMAQDPTQEDIMTGIQLGAVDFLAKPLSPLKLQNIWQHTVRKLMGNMNINCSSDSTPAAQPAGNAATRPATAARKELDAMEVIPEDPEREQAAAGEAPTAAAAEDSSSKQQPKQPAVNTAANVALATMSSLYEPARCPSLSLSRCGSSAATEVHFSLTAAAGSPDSPCKGPSGGASKLQKSRHAPVHSCPSTRSLGSMASSYSTLQLAVPGSPGSPSNSETAAELAVAAAADAAGTSSNAIAQQLQQQRSIKRAVRHPTPVTPASKPPLAVKPQAAAAQPGAAAAATQQPAAGTAAPSGTAKASTAANGPSAVPLPTGLGALPQGMVWGMPMCPLARAPGIVPPSSSSGSSSSQQGLPAAAGMMMPPMSAWGMCGLPMGMPPMGMPGMPAPFMPGFMMPPMPQMTMQFGGFGGAAAAPSMMGGNSMPGSGNALEAAAMQHQDAAAAAAAPVACLPQQQMSQQAAFTGASAAAALSASLGGGAPDAAAAAAAMDIGDAFDFMLGDITAEDDLDVGMIHSGLLDGELTALEKEGLKLPADLAELQEQQQQQQRYQQQQQQRYQQRASLECGSNRLSFDCHGRQRVSFDCSTASTTTGARVSFECSAASRGGMASQRVSFEVNCNSAARGAAIAAATPAAPAAQVAAPAVTSFCTQQQAAAPASGKAPAALADPLLGSMSDLFAACSGDSCSEGSGGLTHVDSCGMLADLQSLFGAGEGCAGVADDGCSGGAAAAAAAGLFDDVMDDLPLELSMKKSSSLAELLNAGLTAMQA